MCERQLAAWRRSVFIFTIALIAGCHQPRLTPKDVSRSNEVSRALVGKQITLRGVFSLRGVAGPFISLGNQQVVYFVPSGSFTWGKPFSEMDGKLVEAKGALKFFHSPKAEPEDQSIARPPDYFYFDAETAQLRLVSN